MGRRYTKFLPLLIFLNAASWYLKNLAPTIFGGDSPELITAGYHLGVAHPTGYPLITLLFKLAQTIPLGSIAWRTNLFNSFLAALIITLLYCLIKNLTIRTLPALVAALFFAFSGTFFGEALISRVYLVNVFFTTLVIYLLTFESANYLSLAVFLSAIGLTNHYFAMLVIPVILLFFFRLQMTDIGRNLATLSFFGLGLMVYLYLPLRSVSHPFPNWATPYNLTYFLNMVTQQSYRFKMLSRELLDIREILLRLGGSFLFEFYFLGAVAALYGLITCFQKRRLNIWNVLLLIVIGNLAIVILYGSKQEFYTLYFLPTYLVGSIYLGLGLGRVYHKFNRLRPLFISTGLILFSLAGFFLGFYFADDLSQRNNFFFYDFAKNFNLSIYYPGSSTLMN